MHKPYEPKAIAWGGRKWELREPMSCPVTREDGMWFVTFEPLRVFAFGDTRAEAEHEFHADMAMLFREYMEAEDDELTPCAQEMKRYLLELTASN